MGAGRGRTHSHGKGTTKVVQNDPGTWVPTVIHGHCVLWRDEAAAEMRSKGLARLWVAWKGLVGAAG